VAATVYALGAFSSLLCAALLLRYYSRSQQRLLLWSGLSFIGLTMTNILLFIDLIAVPDIDLHILRYCITAGSLCLLVFGLVWEER